MEHGLKEQQIEQAGGSGPHEVSVVNGLPMDCSGSELSELGEWSERSTWSDGCKWSEGSERSEWSARSECGAVE